MAAWIDVDLLQQYTHSVSQFSFVENGFHTYPKKNKTKCLIICRSQKRQYNQIINIIFLCVCVYLASANLTLSRQAPYP